MIALFLGALLIGAEPAAGPDVVVVCPAAFRQALTPWVAHRMRQGHRVAFLPACLSADETRGAIRRLAEQSPVRYLLLVGDAEPESDRSPAVRARCVPTHFAEAKVNVRWGSEPQIATDNWYADLDDDAVPDVAVGRLAADSPAELARIVEKILTYERSADFGLWRRRVNFVAGVGGFGRVADAVLETTTRKFIDDGLPAAYAVSMTYASWTSPFCPAPRLFSAATVARLNEGCLFFVYMGHGNLRTLDHIAAPDGRYRILDVADVPSLQCRQGNPIALFMACYTGAFDAPQDCLAEEMLKAPGAPVAIIAGSRVTMPYAMAVLGTELLTECFQKQTPTIGEALLNAKRQMATGERRDSRSQTLDLLASVLSPNPADLAAERKEHVLLFNLLGDPLLALRPPGAVELDECNPVEAGQLLHISGSSPLAGRCTLELVAHRQQLTFTPRLRSAGPETPQVIEERMAEYRRANDPRWATTTIAVERGPFKLALPVPLQAGGPCHVRAFVESREGCALGMTDVAVEPIRPPKPRVVAGDAAGAAGK